VADPLKPLSRKVSDDLAGAGTARAIRDAVQRTLEFEEGRQW